MTQFVCFSAGPPALPPRPGNSSSTPRKSRNNSSRKQRSLSSTYRSFRDSEWSLCESLSSSSRPSTPPPLFLGSLEDSPEPPPPMKILNPFLSRSHSEGNLRGAGVGGATPHQDDSAVPQPARTISRCLRVLSGSWKNLLQCKFQLIRLLCVFVYVCKGKGRGGRYWDYVYIIYILHQALSYSDSEFASHRMVSKFEVGSLLYNDDPTKLIQQLYHVFTMWNLSMARS